MCVQVEDNTPVEPIVLAWKIVKDLSDRGCSALTRKIRYRYGVRYRDLEEKSRFGIQAFVNREDAEKALENWITCPVAIGERPMSYAVIPVLLYEAREGVITSMCWDIDGAAGWTARGILIPEPVKDTYLINQTGQK